MGNYENLKQSITEVIRTNGNQEITGAVLQSTLLTIISTVGANATFAGMATPTTNPGTPDGPVFYLASEGGTYTNFNAIELQDGLSALMWNGSWSSQQIFGVDDVPTAGSDNLVKSGGVQEELALGAVYDVSAKNPTAGVNNDGKWESLSALLEDANLDTLIPISVRKGGMSIKFVQSSDKKYVQYRLMSDTFSTTESDWQGVDEEPTADSDNLVKSGGVYSSTPTITNSSNDSDLDILDDNGNVLVRCENGHIRTKNFSSADVNMEHLVDVGNSENESDIDISDEEGNVITRFRGGHIETKNFDSRKYTHPLISRFKGKSMITFGDSITYGYNTTKKWGNILKTSIEISNYTNPAVSGYQITNIISSIHAASVNYDLVFVWGGTNDWANGNVPMGEMYTGQTGTLILNTDTNTFYGRIASACQLLLSKYPTAEIYFMTPMHRKTFQSQYANDLTPNSAGCYLHQYVQAIKDVTAYYSIPCIDLWSEAGINPNIEAQATAYFNHNVPGESTPDLLHPDANGHIQIAKVVERFIEPYNV